MKGRNRFNAIEANEIRSTLVRVRTCEPNEQKRLRRRLRAIGFYISDWDIARAGFTCSDFNQLCAQGRITIDTAPASSPSDGPETALAAAPTHKPSLPRWEIGVQAVLVAFAIEALTKRRHRLADAPASVKNVPGLYAIYGDAQAWRELGLGNPCDERPLYVGKAEDSLISRDLDTHFGNGRTGSSTVRRSLAALLREPLGLRGIPRNSPKPERPANFGLTHEHDHQLSRWMSSRLLLATWPKPPGCSSLVEIEKDLIRKWRPPLNILHNRDSPWKHQLAAAREFMANDAREWARDRGYKI